MFKNATLYSAKPPPSKQTIADIPGVKYVDIDLDRRGIPSRYVVRINGITVKITVMPEADVAKHLAGFYGFLMHLTDRNPSPNAQLIAGKIQSTTTVLGCVLEPEMDAERMAGDMLFFLNYVNDGLLFTNDTIFGPDANPLIGA